MSLTNTTYYGFALVTAPKIDTDLLWMLTAIFIGLALIYLLSVFFFRNKISSRSAVTRKRKKELSPMISEFLFYEDDVDKAEKSHYIDLKIQIRELLKTDFNRKVLTEILLDLRKDVSGDTKFRLFKLYQDLGLEKDAFEKLKSWRWEVVSKGISQLTQMHVNSAYGFITKFINHRKATIRKQAEIAIVTLKPEGINYFLDTTRYKISEWQQVKLLEVVRNQEDLDPPRFKMWLTSTNKHVVLFALRLIKYYNQNDANTSLIELVKHKNNQIKAEALSCIKEFNVVEALPILKQVFSKCSVDIKIAILDAVGNLGSPSDVTFLNDIAKRERNFSVKSKALSAVNLILPDTVMPTKGIQNIGAYVEPDADFDTSNESIMSDASEPVQEETVSGHLEMNNVEPNEEVDDENVEQNIASVELEQNSPDEGLKNESDIVGNLDVIYQEVTADQKNTVLSEIETIATQNIEEENIVTNDHMQDAEVTQQDAPVFVESTEVTNNDSDSLNEEITLEPSEPIPETSRTEQDTVLEEQSSDSLQDHFFQLDFVPIVTTGESTPNQNLEKYRPMANTENPEIDIKNIAVDFEEIIPSRTSTDEDTGADHFDISEINFLPVVVDTDLKDEHSNLENIETSPEEMEVYHEEISGLPIDDELHNLITEINELNFLPIVVEKEIVPENENAGESEASDTLNDVEGYTLSDFEVNFEEPSTSIEDETVDFDLGDSPIIDVQGPAVDDVMSWLMAHNELREIELQYEIVSADEERGTISELLPEPIYYDEHEAYMMGLLDDLEELGDSREIPFLEELLAVEKKSFIKDRITNLIERFSIQRDGRTTKKKDFDKEDVLPKFSVFADLFKNIDTESKLILLDEIVAVGDEKEIPFLDALLEDPNPALRKKAQIVLKLLIAKISNNDATIEHKKKQEVEELPTRFFDVHTPNETMNREAKTLSNDNLLDREEIQPEAKSEIFEIDFELAEVLDKRHSKNVLDLPVIATEISPNGASFLFQLYNFLKIVSIS